MALSSGLNNAVSSKSLNLAAVPILIGGSNYKKWRREIELLLTLNEYDIALDNPQPEALTSNNTKAKKTEFERWTRDKVALSILESGMTNTMHGGIKKSAFAKDYLQAIENKFQELEKTEIAQYMSLLISYKFEGGGSIRGNIMKMIDAAEFVACFEGMKQVVWLRNLVANMRLVDSVKRPVKMLCDNNSAMFFSKNNKITSASTLMDVTLLKVREMIKKGEIDIQYLSTNAMIADPLTKALPNNLFKRHVT